MLLGYASEALDHKRHGSLCASLQSACALILPWDAKKIHETLPGFKCNWSVKSGIVNLLDELKQIPLSRQNFNRREFYRLQQIEFLHQTHLIDDNLFWVN